MTSPTLPSCVICIIIHLISVKSNKLDDMVYTGQCNASKDVTICDDDSG